jgi:hypothetical protein
MCKVLAEKKAERPQFEPWRRSFGISPSMDSHLSPATSSAAQIIVLNIFITFVFLLNTQRVEILLQKSFFFPSTRQDLPRPRPASGKKVFMFNLAYEKPTLF